MVYKSIAAYRTNMKNPIICAIDTTNLEEAENLVSKLKDYVGAIKLGLEFYTAHGTDGIRQISSYGIPLFLDLKFHDIPNTVRNAVKAACELNPFMITVHVSGGREMLRAAVDAAEGRTKIIGVTVLTSMDDKDLFDIGINKPAREQVIYLSSLANGCGLDGVVCSAHEIGMLKSRFGRDFITVVPGIRPEFSDADDQKRTLPPKKAIEQGADYLVIGRPITKAPDPVKIVQDILDDL